MIALADYDIGKAFRAVENELMGSMIRNMKRHRLEEIDEGKEWEMWQALQLQALEEYKKANKTRFQGKFSDIDGAISSIISEARAQGGMAQEIKILNAIKKGFKPSKASKNSVTTMAGFFRINDRKLDALIRATQNDFKKAEHAMLRMAEDQYRKVIFNAQVYANTGAGTYEKAVDMATKDFLSRGINCIEYANGARHTITDYATMAIKTASKRAYLTGEGEKRQEWGISLVIMKKRGNACPKCLPFVGKVLIDDVWSGGTQSDGPYMLMSTAIARGLYHPRCKDTHTTYFEGITKPGASYTKAELQDIEDDYRQDQKEQYAKRQEERFGRLARYSLDEGNKRRYNNKESEWAKVAKSQKKQFTEMQEGDIISNDIVSESREYRNCVANEEEKICKNNTETAVLIDKSGKVLFRESSGATNYVKFTKEQLAKMKGATLTHNHPSNSTFSSEDVSVMTNYELKAIRATGEKRTYQLECSNDMGLGEKFRDDYREAMKENKKITDVEYAAYGKLYKKGELSSTEYAEKVKGLNTKLNQLNSEWLKYNAKGYGYRYSVIERR